MKSDQANFGAAIELLFVTMANSNRKMSSEKTEMVRNFQRDLDKVTLVLENQELKF